METIGELLTQRTYNIAQEWIEEWEVCCNNQKFYLNGEQMRLVHEAQKAGSRGVLHFKGFDISIPHIAYAIRTRRELKNPPLALPEKTDLTNEEYENILEIRRQSGLKKIQEMREKLPFLAKVSAKGIKKEQKQKEQNIRINARRNKLLEQVNKIQKEESKHRQ